MTKSNPWAQISDKKLFVQVQDDVDRLFDQGEFVEALRVLEETYPGLPTESLHNQMQDLLMTRAFLLSRLERAAETLDVVQAFHKTGYSCPLQWKIFDLVRVLPEYEDAEQENVCLIAAEKGNPKLDLLIYLPKDYDSVKAYPLILLMHGGGQNNDIMQRMWPVDAMLERGFIVAFIQSSQVVYTAHAVWVNDPVTAWKDVRAYYESVCKQHLIDTSSVILGGFSGGAITAIDMAFGEALPVKAFICLCPILKPEHFSPAAVDRGVKRGLRGVFFEGADVWPIDAEEKMVKVMRDAQLPFELVLNEGVGHDSPSDFNVKLGKALDFVMS
jgi:predicted esterase